MAPMILIQYNSVETSLAQLQTYSNALNKHEWMDEQMNQIIEWMHEYIK